MAKGSNRRRANHSAQFHTASKPLDLFGRCVAEPDSRDFIFWSTVKSLEEFNNVRQPDRSLQGYSDPLVVKALYEATITKHKHYTSSSYYLFSRHKLLIRKRLRLSYKSKSEIEKGVVEVQKGERWEPLMLWLETLPASKLPVTGEAGYELQYRRWRDADLPFRFLDLPQELQDKITLNTVGRRVVVRPVHGSPRVPGIAGRRSHLTLSKGASIIEIEHEGTDKDCTGIDPTLFPVSPAELAILQLNRASRKHFLQVFWKDTRKVFSAVGTALARTQISPIWHSMLTHLDLDMSHEDFMELFDVKIPGVRRYSELYSEQSRQTSVLHFPNLRSLDLTFRSTISSSDNPWRFSKIFPSVGPIPLQVVRAAHPCQKIMVDWIMAFAWEHVCHIPRVRLTGYVKQTTRDKWEGILNDKTSTDWAKLVEAEKEAIFALPKNAFPPKCECPLPCYYGAVDALDHFVRCPRHRYCLCLDRKPPPTDEQYREAYRNYTFDYDDNKKPTLTEVPEGWSKFAISRVWY